MVKNFFKKYFNYKIPKAFGVDFNDNSVKVVQLANKGKKCLVESFGSKIFPKGVILDHEIKDIGKFVEVFKSAVKDCKGKIKGSGLVVALPESRVFIRMITVPSLENKELAEAIKWEAESNIPISIEDVYFDWQVVARENESMKVLIVACPKKIIDNYNQVLSNAGFEVLVFEPESIGSGRCAINFEEQRPLMLVDIGQRSTSFSIYENGFPVFTSGSSFSGNMITDVISKKKGISLERAESIKVKIGLGENIKEKQEMEQILNPVIDGLASEIDKTTNFYKEKLSQSSKGEISEVLLSGQGSNLKGITSCLAIKLRTPVKEANPWENFCLDGKIPIIPKIEAQGYVTAIGLAMRANCYEDYN
jgi:type IV pilus assembly protein PilM